MARRAIKSINWGAIAERMTPGEEKIAFANFKAKSDTYFKRVHELPESAPKIDWALYKKNIATPGLVDKLQKEYEALSIPYPQDKYTEIINEEEKKAQEVVKQHISDWSVEIKNSEKEIAATKALIPYAQMTMEDFYDAHPECAINNPDKPSIWPHTPEFQPDGTEHTEESEH